MCSSSSKIVMTRSSYSPPLCTTSTPPPSFALGLGKHLESCGGGVQDDHNDDQEGNQNDHDDHQTQYVLSRCRDGQDLIGNRQKDGQDQDYHVGHDQDDHIRDDHVGHDQDDHVGQYEEYQALRQGTLLASTAGMEVLTKMVETKNDDKDGQQSRCQGRYDLALDRAAKC